MIIFTILLLKVITQVMVILLEVLGVPLIVTAPVPSPALSPAPTPSAAPAALPELSHLQPDHVHLLQSIHLQRKQHRKRNKNIMINKHYHKLMNNQTKEEKLRRVVDGNTYLKLKTRMKNEIVSG